MMTFIHDDFLLTTAAAQRLYHEHAADQPIIDYHNHLSPQLLADNRPFENLFQMWIDGDHYKWRAMRANGIDESRITGQASDREKFQAFAETVPRTLRNPLYHWTHLELKRFFGIDELLGPENAESIWNRCNEQIQQREGLLPQGILADFRVTALCTTDDPADGLDQHQRLADQEGLATKVYPAFRPDWALMVDRPNELIPWVQRLGQIVGREITDAGGLLAALERRHADFHQQGCRLSDHGSEVLPARPMTEEAANEVFLRALEGQPANAAQQEGFATWLLLELAKLDAAAGWTQQFHTGVWRNNNSRLFQEIGRDIGCDSMADTSQGRALGWFLDQLDQQGALPRTIVYNLNPTDNYLVSTMLGNFQGGPMAGKMQFGSGWWYLDQQEGMEWQINTLSNTGLLAHFVGMLTDSRSLMSFPRHEYFRRVLCNLLGQDMEAGKLPSDDGLIGDLVERICYRNARDFLGLAGA